ALAVAAVAPVIGSTVYTLGLTGKFDPAPFTFTITGSALFWGFLRYGLLDVLPVAREAVFEAMGDGVLVLDGTRRIVDINPAALRVLNGPTTAIIGQPLERLLPDLADVEQERTELAIESGDGARRYDVQLSSIQQRDGQIAGYLVVLRDVSALRLSQERFRAQ